MYKITFKDDLIPHDIIIDIARNASLEICNFSEILFDDTVNNTTSEYNAVISTHNWLNKLISAFSKSTAESDGITVIYVPECRGYSIRMCEAVDVVIRNLKSAVITYNIKGFLSLAHYVFTHSKFESVSDNFGLIKKK